MMDTEQKVALDESIAHWRENEDRYDNLEPMHMGAVGCACCRLQVKRTGGSIDYIDCRGCVIAAYTGCTGCHGTPYRAVVSEGEHPSVMRKWLEDLRDGKNPEIWDVEE